MVLIFGAGDQSEDLGEVAPLTCPTCHNAVFLHHVRTKKKFSLYFVPVATLSTDVYLVCPICSHGLAVPANLVGSVGAMSAETTLYRRGGRPESTYRAEVARFWPKMGLRPDPVEPAARPIPGAPPPGPTGTGPAAPVAVTDRAGTAPGLPLADRLAKLAELHARGVLTDDEFAAAKARLLRS